MNDWQYVPRNEHTFCNQQTQSKSDNNIHKQKIKTSSKYKNQNTNQQTS